MHSVGRVDWSFAESPTTDSATSSGLARNVIVGPNQGAVHTELAVGAFVPGGWLQRHVHSFEEALYVLAGELVLDIGGAVHRLVAGDYGFIPLGTWHSLANGGSDQVRWLSVNTPQRLRPRRRTPRHVLPTGAVGRRSSRRAVGQAAHSATPAFDSSAITKARRPRPRRSPSPIRREDASRLGWTPRSWPTAGSP